MKGMGRRKKGKGKVTLGSGWIAYRDGDPVLSSFQLGGDGQWSPIGSIVFWSRRELYGVYRREGGNQATRVEIRRVRPRRKGRA